MRLVLDREEFNFNLSLVNRIVPSRSAHPVLGNILICADKESNQVTLTAFDLSLGATTRFEAKVIEGGKTTLHARLLTEIVSRVQSEDITISVEEPETEITEKQPIAFIKTESAQFQIPTLPASDFPELPIVTNGKIIELPIDTLKEGIRSVLFAASRDETKQVLTGVHLTKKDCDLEFAATDGHRLATARTSVSWLEDYAETISLTIPSRVLMEIDRILSSQRASSNITLKVDDSQVAFLMKNQSMSDIDCILIGRKLENAYPAYDQLIPKVFERSLVLNRKQLIQRLELVSILSDAKSNLVKATIDPENNQLLLSVESPDLGNAKESMPVEILQGDGVEFALNVKYLLEGLKALPSTDIKIELNDGVRPIIFSPMTGIKAVYLLMPVQIKK